MRNTVFTHVINFYLAPYPPHELEENYERRQAEYVAKLELQNKIIAVAAGPSADSEALLQGYVREALRMYSCSLFNCSWKAVAEPLYMTTCLGLDPVIDGVFRHATQDNSIGPVDFAAGTRLWFNFHAAGGDPQVFEYPLEVNPNRPASLYSFLHGDGVFKVLGEEFVYAVATQVLRAVFGLKNVRRTKGPAGTLRRFKDVVIAPPDEMDYDEVPGKGPYGEDVTVKKYKWKTAKGDVAWKWAYLNPEDSNRLTGWATGLTLNVSLFSLRKPSTQLTFWYLFPSSFLSLKLYIVRRLSVIPHAESQLTFLSPLPYFQLGPLISSPSCVLALPPLLSVTTTRPTSYFRLRTEIPLVLPFPFYFLFLYTFESHRITLIPHSHEELY